MSHIPPEQRTLDWRPRFDTRSLAYRVAVKAPGIVERPARSRLWTRHAWLDQGREGACTGFGLAHCVSSSPRSQEMTNEMGHEFYIRARIDDEYPGENYEGSSVLGAMKAGQHYGYVREFWWATTLHEILVGISNYGSMEAGLNWHRNQFYPDADGFITPDGPIEGGHALEIRGQRLVWNRKGSALDRTGPEWFSFVDLSESYATLSQSWGRDHGINGDVRMRLVHLDQLLHEQGEFALPRKVAVRA
jgi:hypothetical protein